MYAIFTSSPTQNTFELSAPKTSDNTVVNKIWTVKRNFFFVKILNSVFISLASVFRWLCWGILNRWNGLLCIHQDWFCCCLICLSHLLRPGRSSWTGSPETFKILMRLSGFFVYAYADFCIFLLEVWPRRIALITKAVKCCIFKRFYASEWMDCSESCGCVQNTILTALSESKLIIQEMKKESKMDYVSIRKHGTHHSQRLQFNHIL